MLHGLHSMTASPRFEVLRSEIETLRSHLLPAAFDPTGAYPPDALTKALAFRVLAHAEIESYLEDRALELSRDALRAYRGGVMRRTLVTLVAFSGLTAEEPPDSLAPPQPTQTKLWPNKIDLGERLVAAVNAYDARVRKNNGIKEPNLLQLLLPIGMTASDLDPVFVANMNAFGERRGAAAHSSGAAVKTQQPPDPEQEYQTVLAMLVELERIDGRLDALLA